MLWLSLRPSLPVGCVIAFPAVGFAQSLSSTYLVEVPGLVSPANPSVTIRVSAAWDPHPLYYSFELGGFDFESDPSGTFSDPRLLPVYTRMIIGPGSRPGIVSGNRVADVLVDQSFRPHNSLFPLRDNPLPIWEVTWTTQDFTPRLVPIQTTGFQWLNVLYVGQPPAAYMQYIPASSFIRVVPAPASLGIVLGGLIFAGRRRR